MHVHSSHTFGLLLFSMPAFSASMMPWARSDRMPSPFTTPAMPYAPPRLVQTKQPAQSIWSVPGPVTRFEQLCSNDMQSTT